MILNSGDFIIFKSKYNPYVLYKAKISYMNEDPLGLKVSLSECFMISGNQLVEEDDIKHLYINLIEVFDFIIKVPENEYNEINLEKAKIKYPEYMI